MSPIFFREQVEYRIDETAHGTWKAFMYENGETYHEFRSHAEMMGLPLYHYTRGKCPETGRAKTAWGVVAVGRHASGVVAFGQVARGLFAFGQLAIGPIAIGQLAIGLIAAGQAAIALGIGVGQFAFGYFAIGMFAAGYFAKGCSRWGLYRRARRCFRFLGRGRSRSTHVARKYWKRDNALTTAEVAALAGVELEPACDPNTGGDIDGNGTVEFADFLVLSSNFGQAVDDHGQGDLDCNGNVEFADFLIMSANFGQAVGTQSVPEPSSSSLLMMVFPLMLLLTRRRRSVQN